MSDVGRCPTQPTHVASCPTQPTHWARCFRCCNGWPGGSIPLRLTLSGIAGVLCENARFTNSAQCIDGRQIVFTHINRVFQPEHFQFTDSTLDGACPGDGANRVYGVIDLLQFAPLGSHGRITGCSLPGGPFLVSGLNIGISWANLGPPQGSWMMVVNAVCTPSMSAIVFQGHSPCQMPDVLTTTNANAASCAAGCQNFPPPVFACRGGLGSGGSATLEYVPP